MILHSHGTNIKGDGINYIEIESNINPTMINKGNINNSIGNIQIIDHIYIQFDIILPNITATNSSLLYYNLFTLKSIDTPSSSYCSQYPSLWISPKNNNTLYFSSLNFNANDSNEYNYCLEPLLSLKPSISYTINIQYDQSELTITSNDTVIFRRFHWFSIIQNTNNITLSLSDLSTSISNLLIITNPGYHPTNTTNTIIEIGADINEDPTDPNRELYPNDVTTKNTDDPHADAEDTIFIIEIAVLTVFAFACLGVIVASCCLFKMRQSSKFMSTQKEGPKGKTKKSKRRNNRNRGYNPRSQLRPTPNRDLRISIPSTPDHGMSFDIEEEYEPEQDGYDHNGIYKTKPIKVKPYKISDPDHDLNSNHSNNSKNNNIPTRIRSNSINDDDEDKDFLFTPETSNNSNVHYKKEKKRLNKHKSRPSLSHSSHGPNKRDIIKTKGKKLKDRTSTAHKKSKSKGKKSIVSEFNASTISDLESSLNFNQLNTNLNQNLGVDDGLKVNRSKSEATYYQHQIPKYDSSTMNTNHSSINLSKIGSRSFKIQTSSSIDINEQSQNTQTNLTPGTQPSATKTGAYPEHALSAPSNSALAFLHSKKGSSGARSDAVIMKGRQLSHGCDSISPAVNGAPDLPDSPQELQTNQRSIIKPSDASRDIDITQYLDVNDDENNMKHRPNNKTMIVHPDPNDVNGGSSSSQSDDDHKHNNGDSKLLESELEKIGGVSDCDYDVYDLNSEEGDDIKLRRAAIQSQRYY